MSLLQKELGWSHAALVAGARQVGVSPAIVGSLDNGGADLVQVRKAVYRNLTGPRLNHSTRKLPVLVH